MSALHGMRAHSTSRSVQAGYFGRRPSAKLEPQLLKEEQLIFLWLHAAGQPDQPIVRLGILREVEAKGPHAGALDHDIQIRDIPDWNRDESARHAYGLGKSHNPMPHTQTLAGLSYKKLN
jgi:hypothetical protein